MTATEPAVPAPALPVVRRALPGAGYALGVLTFINVINYLDRYLVAGILPRIEDTLHIDHAQGGLLQSMFIVVYMLVAPLGGYVGDRYPRRWVLSLSILIWSFATFGSGLAGTFAVLLMARALVGVGEAGYGTVSPGLIADFFPLTQRTRALSVFYVAIPVGSALGFALGGWIGNTWSWHAAFFVGGVPGLLAAFLALRMREPARGATEEGGASSQTKIPFMEGLRGLRSNTFYWVSVAGLTLMTFSIGGLAVF
ncbi:MAG TPA: MFS transporter, partial [Myxococcaceae bacterium]